MAFFALSALAALLVAGQQAADEPAALARLAKWVERLERSSAEVQHDDLADLRALVGEMRMSQALAESERVAALPVLLDLAGLEKRRVEAQRGRFPAARTPREQASELGFEALEGALAVAAPTTCAWFSTELLAQPEHHPAPRRRAALELVRKRHEPTLLLPILSSAIDRERSVRDAAMAALEGWDDEGVHRFMLQQLQRVRSDGAWVSSLNVYQHFARVTIAPDGALASELRVYCQGEVMSENWRRAVGGARLLATLSDELAVPVLIEGLSLWVDRRETELASKRVEGDFERDLRRRSGRNLGFFPERWARWWRSKTAGGTQAPADDSGETSAGFFGLHPWTDRVVFVIDRSGSMKGRFQGAGTTGATSRYAEAMRQMEALLHELGPETRFRVVLFESGNYVWRDKLSLASKANLSSLRTWCAAHLPDGGTALRAGVEEVLRLDRAGEPNLARIEEDTVIVLCDGETAEGPSWVEPLLERTGGETGLMFHCVQIGSAGDGTLQQLAELSGGEFVQVDG